jgi:leucyl aminopeptidase (aminopeptidase T)
MKQSKETMESLRVRVARKVLSETLGVKKGESVTIETWSNSLPLALDICLEAKRRGAIPIVVYEDEEGFVRGIREASKDSLGVMGRHEYGLLAATDAYVFIPGPPIAGYSRKVSRQEFMDTTRYNESWYKAAEKAKLRGARLTPGYIGEDIAEALGRTVEEIVRLQMEAALVDLDEVGRLGRDVAAKLHDGVKAAVKGAGTNLSFELKGELEVQDGRTDASDVSSGNNVSYVPPGYVFKEVEGGSAKGRAQLSSALTRFGLLKDADLLFEEGRIVEWSTKSSPKVLKAMEEAIPEESRVLNGITVGINPVMKFGFGQDRFPAGSLGLIGAFPAILPGATLSVGRDVIVKGGVLLRS